MYTCAQLDSTIVRVNRGWEYVLGYTSQELEGTSFMDLVHPDDQESTLEELSKLGSGKNTFYFENRYRHKGGSYRILAWSALASVEDQMVFAVATDITERKQAEAALQESEERYRSLLEQAPIGIGVFVDDKITFLNPAGAKLLGASSPDQLIGLPITKVIHPDYHAMLVARREQWYSGGPKQYPVEYILMRVDGEPIDAEIVSTPYTDKDRSGVQVLVRDVSMQKRAEAESARLLAQVQAQAQQISQILDSVPESVLLLDQDARVVLVNPTAARELRSLANVGVGDVLTHLGDLPLADLLTSAHEGPWHEIHAGTFTYEATARPLDASQNEAIGGKWVVVLKDVTRERAIGVQLQQQERLAAVGQLAAGIAHDFNNILAILSLQGAMAAQTPQLPTRVGERLDVINNQTAQATRLVQQILDFSRRSILDRRPVNLQMLLKEQVDLLAHTLPEHIEIELQATDADCTVMADSTRIQQMVMNLALNARDAMPRGGRLCLTLTRHENAPLTAMDAVPWIQLTISDTGVGIPPEVMPHLFEPFFTTKPRERGTGLGLAQVYGIIKQHAGEIQVQSNVDRGTSVSIYLPAVMQTPEVATAPTFVSPNDADATILLVEDNAALLEAMSDTLMMLGYTVIGAGNGKEALSLLECPDSDIDLVLTDLVMPQMGGDALLTNMRAHGLSTPVIVLSGHPLSGELDSLTEQGLVGWLLKPPDIDHLSQLIAQTLQH
ncbi:MAG: PAS domain S-box protein [Caldilineaceae bacterium]